MKTAVLVALSLCIAAIEVTALSVNVQTSSGPVIGEQVGTYLTWKGIPYATAPRWQSPGSPAPWTTPRQSTAFGPCCPQPSGEFTEFRVLENTTYQAEECLSLNIWSPVGASNMPVLVYLYGGGYVVGCSSRDRYHGAEMAGNTPTVVVTINYRLGALGFLAGGGLAGNYAIMDQQAALMWVQKNIANFGGDPQRVTLDGQSAGAISVATHMAMPSTQALKPFRAAIMQSNPVLIQFRALEDQQAQFNVFATALGCGFARSRVACMRALPWQTILDKQNWGLGSLLLNNTWQNVIYKLPWAPTVDGSFVTQTPSTAYQSGNFYKVPTLLGTVANETLGFLPLLFGDGSTANFFASIFYRVGLNTLFGSLADKVRAHYPNTVTNSEDAVGRVLTDFSFICPVLQSATWISKHTPTYVYQFSHAPGCDPNNYHHPVCKGRVCHSSDVDFVFHSLSTDRRGNCAWSPAESQLSWDMLHSWTNFTADPFRFANVPLWQGNNVYQFDLPSRVSNAVWSSSQCNLWASIISGSA